MDEDDYDKLRLEMVKHPDFRIIVWSQIKHMCNFDPLEVVGRGSETQLQVGENLNQISWSFNPFKSEFTIVIFIPYKPRIAILDL